MYLSELENMFRGDEIRLYDEDDGMEYGHDDY